MCTGKNLCNPRPTAQFRGFRIVTAWLSAIRAPALAGGGPALNLRAMRAPVHPPVPAPATPSALALDGLHVGCSPRDHQVQEDGFSIVADVMDPAGCLDLRRSLGPAHEAGRRGLLASPPAAALARSNRLLDLVRPHLPSEPFPVRAIYFDKSPLTNWLVAWHQDLTLAVRSRVDTPGFGPWSTKDGVPHVQPPVRLLEQMLAVRLHLDDADASNGALRVLPGSHRFGRLPPKRIQELRAAQTEFLCAVPAGGALLMRPLLLHASSRSTSTRHRRVLHIEYAGFGLPAGLEWHEQLGHTPMPRADSLA